jgi:glycosyltransferase involved in cell wall biosynthesis
VLQVSPAYAPSVGGVETCVREVATNLRARQVDAQVLTADPSHALPRFEIVGRVPVQRVRAWPRGADYKFAPGVASAVRHGAWDVVHIQCYQSLVAPIAMAAAKRAGTPYVLTFHGGGHSSRLRHSLRRHQLRVLRPLIAGADGLVATAEWEIGAYSATLGLPEERFSLIPNGGNLPAAPPGVRPDASPVIVSIGRAERYKGHQHVLRALPGVLRDIPDARLWIAGEGPYEPELAELAVRLGVRDRVEIGPVRDREEYARKLGEAAVAVLFSEFETHPMGALEAVTVGVPLLVADNSGLSELSAKGYAHALPTSSNSEAIAGEIVRLSRLERTTVQLALPTWDQCAASHLDLYDRVLATRGSR